MSDSADSITRSSDHALAGVSAELIEGCRQALGNLPRVAVLDVAALQHEHQLAVAQQSHRR